ncbi:MAG: type I DNA topoisomerase [Planctomycetaceae bacterium]|nr:type I DNA topoisomerase [Planctomycetaceae bacterium]
MATQKKTTKRTPRKAAPRSAGGGSAGVGKNLVVVESPAKIKSISKYLGPGYVVKASMGHVRDLPKKNIGVDVDHDFAPAYEPVAGKERAITELRKFVKAAPTVYLATDLDREGEAIAWHLSELFKLPADRVRRVVFNEITASAIRAAFEHPREVNINKVNAQQARRILDRLVGYEVSPLLWKKVSPGLSAGRVQTVAVRLIVEREREIEAFTPEEYWRVGAIFCLDGAKAAALTRDWQALLAQRDEKGNGPTKDVQQDFLAKRGGFRAELATWKGQKFSADNERQALEVAQAMGLAVKEIVRCNDPQAKGPARSRAEVVGAPDAKGPTFTVGEIQQRQTRSRPPGPFTTASLQQAASVQLRFGAARTMRIAQGLYEGVDVPGEGSVGLITYMRTDSTSLSAEALDNVRKFVGEKFGQKYLPEKPNFYGSTKRTQEAHEAIRPTDANRRPEDLQGCLTPEQHRLYQLIWRRFVACQMSAAEWLVTEAAISAATPAGEAVFKAMGRRLAFDGYLRVAGLPKSGDQILPPLQTGNRAWPVELLPTQHFTQGPPRYTEASLVKALEADGIGRPSTYAAIIGTIQERQYVEMRDRSFYPTHLGVVVTDKLVQAFTDIFDVRFTAAMEDRLDKVEEAQVDWVRVLRDFYKPFQRELKKAFDGMVHAKAESQPSDYKCDQCGKPMVYRFSKTGRYLACTGYPECKVTHPVDENGQIARPKLVDVACPQCGKEMQFRKGRFGPFLSCSGYPDCKGIVNLDRKGFVKQPAPPALVIDDIKCTKCGSPLNLRRGKRGPWLACSAFPKCRGRFPWADLDPAMAKRLEAALAEHEKAHPQKTITNMAGQPVSPTYKPQAGAAAEEPAPDIEE